MAMRKTILLTATVLLMSCGDSPGGSEANASMAASAAAASASPTHTATATANLGACPARSSEDVADLGRKGPLPLPPSLSGLAKADRLNLAVTTINGGTVCADLSWIEEITQVKVSPDKRFVAFDWLGYEAFGHLIIDRAAKGQVLETGNAPLAPPTGRRFAAIDLSESGFGALNAFAVWDIESNGLREIAKFSEGLPSGDWKLGEWSGDSCINLSVLPVERQPSDAADFERAERDDWYASAANGWKPEAGRCK
jgi:hypothetical protein